MLLLILLSDLEYFNVSNNPSMFSYMHYRSSSLHRAFRRLI